MVMGLGFIYEGKFLNDKFYSSFAKLYLPSMTIFEGGFSNGRASNIGMLKYPNGDIYYGQ